jgi:putative NADH-flavin reductase
VHLALFGATGRTGRRVVGHALAFGHTVTALARDPSRLAGSQSLTIVRGDVLDPVAVGKTIAGAQAVLVTLGGGSVQDPGTARSEGMRTIVTAMQQAGITRIVALGGAGVLDAVPGPGLRSEQPGYPAVFALVSREHRAAWEILAASDLEWTFVCPPDIPDAAPTGVYKVAADVFPAGGTRSIPNGDVAAFMLGEVSRRQFVKKRVGITT